MRHKIIILFPLAIAVIALLGACAPARITAPNIRASVKTLALKTGHDGALHSNLRMTLLMPPVKNVHFYRFLFPDDSPAYIPLVIAAGCDEAAQAILGRIGSISGKTTFTPHLIARIKKANCREGFTHITCMASMDLYWGAGGFIRTYKAKADVSSGLVFTATTFNTYVKIFESIAKQMLSDKSLSPYFDHGFDNSPASAILARARSRGYASEDEIKSALSLRSDPLNLMNAFILDSLLPFSRERDQALAQGNIRRVQSVSRHWRNWLQQCQGHVSQKAGNSIKKQLASLDRLDRRLNDPVLGQLTMKLAKAIKQERWKDAKDIQSLIREMKPPGSIAAQAVHGSQTQPGAAGEKCERDKQDYRKALAAYNAAKSERDSSRGGETLGLLGSLSRTSEAGLSAVLANMYKNGANDAQADMDNALRLMLNAKSKMAADCGN